MGGGGTERPKTTAGGAKREVDYEMDEPLTNRNR
jgi:hypothetical protein